MPTYEYECSDCKQRFDRVQSFNDEPIRVCPHCGGPTRRVIHASGVIFKGSGWYINDSRKPDSSSSTATVSKAADGGDKAAPSDKSDKPAGPGDGKAAPASDTAAAKPAEPSKAAPTGES